jgi:hypothetical protein
LRLRLPRLRDNRLIAGEFVTFIAELICFRRLEAVLLRMTAAIREFAALLHLLAVRHDDAVVMLGVLQIVFSKNRIASRKRISCECHIFFGNMRRRAAYFGIGSGRFKAAGERVLAALPVMLIVIAPSATATVLLALPHFLFSR